MHPYINGLNMEGRCAPLFYSSMSQNNQQRKATLLLRKLAILTSLLKKKKKNPPENQAIGEVLAVMLTSQKLYHNYQLWPPVTSTTSQFSVCEGAYGTKIGCNFTEWALKKGGKEKAAVVINCSARRVSV